MAAQPLPVVFRTRTRTVAAVWVVLVLGVILAVEVFAVINLGIRLSPSPALASGISIGLVIALLNRPRPIGLDPAGLRVGSPDKGYLIPWSNLSGVVTVPGNWAHSERIRIA